MTHINGNFKISKNSIIILKNSTKSDAELSLLAQSYAALHEQFKPIYISTHSFDFFC